MWGFNIIDEWKINYNFNKKKIDEKNIFKWLADGNLKIQTFMKRLIMLETSNFVSKYVLVIHSKMWRFLMVF